jgi:prevent-host-death family protein
MTKTPRSIPAGEFKAKCLALLDDVATTGENLVVTKHGKPVAMVIPFAELDSLLGSVLREEDLVEPIGEPWDAEG